MARKSALLSAALLSSYHFVTAIPSQGPRLSTRQDDGCTSIDPETTFDAACWASLDLTNYITNWRSPKTCGTQDHGIGCCNDGELWSTCFLRLGTGHSGYDCSQIQVNTNNCAYSDQLASTLTGKEAAQVRYILRTIFNINAFFNDWYEALQYAITQTALTIDPIVSAVNPPTGVSVSFTNVLTALAAGLPFIGSPIFAAEIAASASAKAFVTALQGTPGLIKALFPTGPGSDTIQIGTLSTELKNAGSKISDRINAGLASLMSDQSAFASFASSGAFSSDPRISIPQQVTEISQALQLFVLTTALTGNGIWGALSPDKDDSAHAVRDDNCWYNGKQECYLDGSGFGDPIFAALVKSDAANVNLLSLMDSITANGWASPQLLYTSAAECSVSGNFGKDLVNINSDSTLNFACLNQLIECYWYSYTDTLAAGCVYDSNCSYLGGPCPARHCPNIYENELMCHN